MAAGWLAATVTGIVFAQAGGSGLGASGSGGPAPGERPQAAAGHAQAGNRVALLSLWISDWTPPSQQPRQNCSGGACTTTEGGWDGPDIQINGDHFNHGPVVVEIRGNDGTVLWSGVAGPGPDTGFRWTRAVRSSDRGGGHAGPLGPRGLSAPGGRRGSYHTSGGLHADNGSETR